MDMSQHTEFWAEFYLCDDINSVRLHRSGYKGNLASVLYGSKTD